MEFTVMCNDKHIINALNIKEVLVQNWGQGFEVTEIKQEAKEPDKIEKLEPWQYEYKDVLARRINKIITYINENCPFNKGD